MNQRLPAIFLSSTFYDLRQIRADVAAFVEQQLGYRLLAAEAASFPVDPSIDTIENCRRVVESDADVLVLLIGSRYGSIPSGLSRSITNIEYDIARANGLPIFAFVQQDLLALLPLWERNPNADFSTIVDSVGLFEFIKRVRAADRVWMFPFTTAADIVTPLRIQLAHEVARGLVLSRRLRGVDEVAGLTGEALRIAVERPTAWALKLLARLIQDEVARSAEMRHDHVLQIAVGAGEHVEEAIADEWLKASLDHVDRTIAALQIIVDRAMNEAANSKSISAIRHSARLIGDVYRDCFEWAARLRRAYVHPDRRLVLFEQSFMLDNVIGAIEQLGPTLAGETDKAAASDDDPIRVDVSFKISVANLDRIHEAIAEFRRKRA
jgi:Domain of unknown function (DUF4062)